MRKISCAVTWHVQRFRDDKFAKCTLFLIILCLYADCVSSSKKKGIFGKWPFMMSQRDTDITPSLVTRPTFTCWFNSPKPVTKLQFLELKPKGGNKQRAKNVLLPSGATWASCLAVKMIRMNGFWGKKRQFSEFAQFMRAVLSMLAAASRENLLATHFFSETIDELRRARLKWMKKCARL